MKRSWILQCFGFDIKRLRFLWTCSAALICESMCGNNPTAVYYFLWGRLCALYVTCKDFYTELLLCKFARLNTSKEIYQTYYNCIVCPLFLYFYLNTLFLQFWPDSVQAFLHYCVTLAFMMERGLQPYVSKK